jgi:hypothetical protein
MSFKLASACGKSLQKAYQIEGMAQLEYKEMPLGDEKE